MVPETRLAIEIWSAGAAFFAFVWLLHQWNRYGHKVRMWWVKLRVWWVLG